MKIHMPWTKVPQHPVQDADKTREALNKAHVRKGMTEMVLERRAVETILNHFADDIGKALGGHS